MIRRGEEIGDSSEKGEKKREGKYFNLPHSCFHLVERRGRKDNFSISLHPMQASRKGGGEREKGDRFYLLFFYFKEKGSWG